MNPESESNRSYRCPPRKFSLLESLFVGLVAAVVVTVILLQSAKDKPVGAPQIVTPQEVNLVGKSEAYDALTNTARAYFILGVAATILAREQYTNAEISEKEWIGLISSNRVIQSDDLLGGKELVETNWFQYDLPLLRSTNTYRL